MEIEFDPAKDAKNRRDRGLPFTAALVALANLVGEVEDARRNYGSASSGRSGRSAGDFTCASTRCA